VENCTRKPPESFHGAAAAGDEVKRATYLLSCLMIFMVALHAQAPPTPAPTAGVSATDTRAGDLTKVAAPLQPLDTAARLYRTGKLTEAESAYKEILQGDAQSAAAYVGLVHVNLRQKKLPEAEAALAKAVELGSNSSAVRVAQGEVHFRQGRILEAQDDFTPLVKANAPEARAYLGLGRIYWAGSLRLHAKLMFELAHDKDPGDPDIRRSWLFTLRRKERIQALKGMLSEEVDEDQDDRSHLETSLATMEEAEEEGRTGCRLASKITEAHMPLERLSNGMRALKGYGLKTQLNGVKASLLVDTGSSGILISKKIAEKAGITSIVKTDVHGIGDKGTVGSFVGVTDSITIGELEFQGCHVEVMERNSVADEDGLIGADVFSHFLVGIDFPNGKLNLTPLPALPPLSESEKALVAKYPRIAGFRDRHIGSEFKSYSPVFRFGHMLLIPTRINDLPPKLFLIDTGAFSDTISPAAAREVTKVRGESNIQVKGLNGAVKNVFTADNLTLTFSHFRQPARDMVAFDTTRISNSSGVEISGMLGFAMLYQMEVKIDYRDGLVDFGYDPNRWH
jgi:tetratricopeptide (TPR) repeat protein